MLIRINVYNRDGVLINAWEFSPGKVSNGKFDANTQQCFDQAMLSVSKGGSFTVQEVLV